MKIQNKDATVTAEIAPGTEALYRTISNKQGIPYSCSGSMTGGVSFVANAACWVMRNAFSGRDKANPPIILVDRVRLKITLIAATGGLSASHRFALYRGAATTTAPTLSGGSAVVGVPKKSLSPSGLGTINTQFGEIRISTTAALTHANVTYDTMPVREANCAWMGTAGQFYDVIWEFSETENQQLSLSPGQFLAVRTPIVFTASTFVVAVDCDYREVGNYPLQTS